VKKWMEPYLEMLRVRNYAPSTIKGCTHILRRFFAHLQTVGVADLRAVNQDIIEAYQRKLLPPPRRQHRAQHMATLRGFFAIWKPPAKFCSIPRRRAPAQVGNAAVCPSAF